MCRSVDHDSGESGTTTGFDQIAASLTFGFHHGVMYSGRRREPRVHVSGRAVKVIT
jgi:hypothetical protein